MCCSVPGCSTLAAPAPLVCTTYVANSGSPVCCSVLQFVAECVAVCVAECVAECVAVCVAVCIAECVAVRGAVYVAV